MEGFLVKMDIVKALDSIDQNFLSSALEKYGFVKNVISSVKILLRNQKLGVLNDATTTKYFLPRRGGCSNFSFIIYFEFIDLISSDKIKT